MAETLPMFGQVRDHEHAQRVDGRWYLPESGVIRLRVAYNGSNQAIWCCRYCPYRSSPVPHELAGDVDSLVVVDDQRGGFARCCVVGCDADDIELNHFGPQAIFGPEAERWPKGYLCRKHHQEWGERVTPHLNGSR